jgi:hypothetical protein
MDGYVALTTRFVIKSLLWFAILVETISLIEPDRIKVPILRVYEVCNFQVCICPCGFYCMYENNLKQHVRNHHSMTREFMKKYSHGQFNKEILYEKLTSMRL